MAKKIIIVSIVLLVAGFGYFILKNYKYSVVTSAMQKDPAYEQLQSEFDIKMEKVLLSDDVEVKLYLTSQADQNLISQNSDSKGLLGGLTSIPVLTLIHKYVKDFTQVEITIFDKNNNSIFHRIVTQEELAGLVKQGVIK